MVTEPTPGARLLLCRSTDLVEAGPAVPFDVRHAGLTSRAFAIRYAGTVRAFFNRCSHAGMELDGRLAPDQVFDGSGRWLICRVHGAAYDPASGACAGGPCRGALVAIALTEQDGWVHWHTSHNLQPATFP